MSAVVLEFTKPKQQSVEAAHYFCLKCNGDTFKAHADGRLHCFNCGARMSNIFVRQQ